MDEFECISCTEEKYGRPYTVANDKVCGDCLVHIFGAAIEDEQNFPPKWGATTLDPELYGDVLHPAYMQRYAQRREEWSFEALDRVYCNARARGAAVTCGNFLGGRSGRMVLAQCAKCQAWTCRHCRELIPAGRNANHRCNPNVEREDQARAFEGLEKGKHYQVCPRCDRRYALGDGCNHVKCGHPCGTWFCFLCGAECNAGYGHFSFDPNDGKCALYPPYRDEAMVPYNGGAPAPAPPVFDEGLVADLEGAFGPAGNARADLQEQQERLLRGFRGGIGFGNAAGVGNPLRQFGQAPAPWREQVPQAGSRNPFAYLDAGMRNQKANPEARYRQALVQFAEEPHGEDAGQGPGPMAQAEELPLDDRLDEALHTLGRATTRILTLAEFYFDDADAPVLVNARILHNGLLDRWRLALRSAEEQPRMYHWAVQQYQHLSTMPKHPGVEVDLYDVALSPALWQQWCASNLEDPRMARVTIVAGAERPGDLLAQEPNFAHEVGGVSSQGLGALSGQQLRGVLNPQPAGFLDQQVGDFFDEQGGGLLDGQANDPMGLQAGDLLGQGLGGNLGPRPRDFLGGWSGRL